MSKRKYQKKSEYWDKNKEVSEAAAKAFVPLMAGEVSYGSRESCRSEGGTKTRRNNVVDSDIPDSLANIDAFSMPYNTSDSGNMDARDCIVLCQKAYFNIGLFRNAIDVMTEFSNTPVRVRGGNKESRKFVKAWLDKIKISRVEEQFFREYYRSGNTFIFKMEGTLDLSAIKDFSKIYSSASTVTIPLKYTIINPANIVLQGASSYISPVYKKILSKYETDALASPKNAEDKAIFDQLPEMVKQQITKKGTGLNSQIFVPIDPKKLYTVFYKKQDYEPFSVPFGYPVLKDFNFKIELKKIDIAISRTIQNVTLLVTMGEQGGNGKASTNPHAMTKMQELFTSQSVARVIVSDYTTEAKFVIPEIGNILDPKKYEIVERDIREGLMLLVGGEGEKFSNQEAKVKIFIGRLEEGRKAFTKEFLQEEVKTACKAMGFKVFPEVYLEDIKFRDDVQFNRIYTRLLELGVLTPEQMFDAVQSGVLPEQEILLEGQQEYIDQRKKGMFNPLVAGTPFLESAEGKATRKTQVYLAEQNPAAPAKPGKPAKTPKTSGAPNPNSTKNGRPPGSVANLAAVVQECYRLANIGESLARAKFSTPELSVAQKDSVLSIVESVMSSSMPDKWESNVSVAFEDFSKIERNYEVMEQVDDLSLHEEVDNFAAALLFHARAKE